MKRLTHLALMFSTLVFIAGCNQKSERGAAPAQNNVVVQEEDSPVTENAMDNIPVGGEIPHTLIAAGIRYFQLTTDLDGNAIPLPPPYPVLQTVRNADEWNSLWANFTANFQTSTAAIPPVDFNQNMVVSIVRTRPACDNTDLVVTRQAEPDIIQFTYTYPEPVLNQDLGSITLCPAVMTSSTALYTVPNSPLPVVVQGPISPRRLIEPQP